MSTRGSMAGVGGARIPIGFTPANTVTGQPLNQPFGQTSNVNQALPLSGRAMALASGRLPLSQNLPLSGGRPAQALPLSGGGRVAQPSGELPLSARARELAAQGGFQNQPAQALPLSGGRSLLPLSGGGRVAQPSGELPLSARARELAGQGGFQNQPAQALPLSGGRSVLPLSGGARPIQALPLSGGGRPIQALPLSGGGRVAQPSGELPLSARARELAGQGGLPLQPAQVRVSQLPATTPIIPLIQPSQPYVPPTPRLPAVQPQTSIPITTPRIPLIQPQVSQVPITTPIIPLIQSSQPYVPLTPQPFGFTPGIKVVNVEEQALPYLNPLGQLTTGINLNPQTQVVTQSFQTPQDLLSSPARLAPVVVPPRISPVQQSVNIPTSPRLAPVVVPPRISPVQQSVNIPTSPRLAPVIVPTSPRLAPVIVPTSPRLAPVIVPTSPRLAPVIVPTSPGISPATVLPRISPVQQLTTIPTSPRLAPVTVPPRALTSVQQPVIVPLQTYSQLPPVQQPVQLPLVQAQPVQQSFQLPAFTGSALSVNPVQTQRQVNPPVNISGVPPITRPPAGRRFAKSNVTITAPGGQTVLPQFPTAKNQSILPPANVPLANVPLANAPLATLPPSSPTRLVSGSQQFVPPQQYAQTPAVLVPQGQRISPSQLSQIRTQ